MNKSKKSEPADLQAVSLKIDPEIWMKAKIVSVQRGCSPSLVVQAALVFYINSLLPSGAEPSEQVKSTEPVSVPVEKTCTGTQSK